MADSALTPDPLERYGAIERSYCEERWTAVIHDGQSLLSDLAHSVEAPPEGLKERLQLLIGHAYLYGLGDRDSAEDHYQAVLRSGAEASLRQIAEQGLQQCVLPVGPAEIEEEDQAEPATGQLAEAGAAPSAWQEPIAWDSPAEPAPAAPLDGPSTPESDAAPPPAVADGWGTASAPTSPEPTAALDWLSAGTLAASPPGSLPQPVMPWLESSDAAAAMPPPPGPAVDAQDLAASGEPLQPQDGSPQPAQPGSPFAAAPVSAPPTVSDLEPAVLGGEIEPLLSPETASSLAATAAAVAAALQRSETGLPPEPLTAEPQAPGPASGDGQELPEPATAGSEAAVELVSASSLPLEAEERVVADVVDEPELIELHQASDRRREEILLEPADAPGESVAEPEEPMQAAVLSDAPAEAVPPPGVQDRRGSSPGSLNVEESLKEEAETEPPAEPAPIARAAAVAAARRVQVGAGEGPFSTPPEPVAEEDPELLMGLLKVEMG